MPALTNPAASIAIALFLAAAAGGQGRLGGRGTARRFVSDKYGFSVAVPPRWLVDPSGDTPVFFSFSPSEAGDFNHQLKLPMGGAVISIVAAGSLPGRHPSTLSDWASADARGVSAEAPSVRPFEVPSETGITAAVISSFDGAVFGPQDQSEHHVSVFWEFQHAFFASHLLYPANDPKGPEFEKALEDNVRSIRRAAGQNPR